jgi:hypothetical protein
MTKEELERRRWRTKNRPNMVDLVQAYTEHLAEHGVTRYAADYSEGMLLFGQRGRRQVNRAVEGQLLPGDVLGVNVPKVLGKKEEE